LPPLERLVKYSKSDIALQRSATPIFLQSSFLSPEIRPAHDISRCRLVHVKSMADTARQVGYEESLEALTDVMESVVGDDETDVRLTLAEQIGELAQIYLQVRPCPTLNPFASALNHNARRKQCQHISKRLKISSICIRVSDISCALVVFNTSGSYSTGADGSRQRVQRDCEHAAVPAREASH
jgi:hypothetical protein